MNCRLFRKNHVAFVDDTVSGFERALMQGHLLDCPACAKHDARVRRALLLVRNLSPIEPSAGFRERLHARLLVAAMMPERAMARPLTLTRLAAAAALLITSGLIAQAMVNDDRGVTLSLPPVVATAPEEQPTLIESPVFTAPAVVASFSTGLALWPTALVADEAADYFANAGFIQANLTR